MAAGNASSHCRGLQSRRRRLLRVAFAPGAAASTASAGTDAAAHSCADGSPDGHPCADFSTSVFDAQSSAINDAIAGRRNAHAERAALARALARLELTRCCDGGLLNLKKRRNLPKVRDKRRHGRLARFVVRRSQN